MKTKRYLFVAMLFMLAFIAQHSAQGQDDLTEEGIEILFGDLSRPADVLLAEAQAKVAKSALGRRLTVYMSIQEHLTERRAFNVDELETEPGTKIDNKENAAEIEQLERGLKQTESDIRELSARLSSNWLPPVQTSIDDQQGATLLQRANVLVTIRSKAGEVLEPTKLTLTAPGVSPIGFVQFRPGVYLAGDVSPGVYQLAWQLTPPSIVQRVSEITIGEAGCIACEVVLGLPKPKCTTKTVDAIVFPHRSTTGQGYNISGFAPSLSIALPAPPQPSYDAPTKDTPPATVAKLDVTTSESDAATRALIASEVEEPKIVAKETLLSLPILWDEECLFNQDLIGLKFQTLSGERVVFFVSQQSTESKPKPSALTPVVELHYQNGNLHGKVRRWSEEGTLLVEIPYRNGLMDGESRFFNRKGKRLGTSKLVQGTGTYRIWDRNKDEPELMKEVEYVDGKERPKP